MRDDEFDAWAEDEFDRLSVDWELKTAEVREAMSKRTDPEAESDRQNVEHLMAAFEAFNRVAREELIEKPKRRRRSWFYRLTHFMDEQ